ncbi:3,4-dihydroxy-2-butanone 4-phosphate synthase [Methanoculleus taiwanensis]|uniref:3,4-dihydroxy-2-butanone 4-phosphate synthase n=1 Tax=Methanoculleus taiwanensis TaxID=1550565 RepID=A0A498GZV5_9EURY|nr:3,4-dihydroxy-2-butanone-4-phosphate synthase [Methanoculleus taiwanensis]RXE55644.1 3,4-dihydroxy-2-butanone 4-phosphate synthase [Methanoculleus taiwanensis]
MMHEALRALANGEFILLYDFDDRERETDLTILADAVTPAHVRQMRKDAGGLICTAVHPEAAKRLGLPFAREILGSGNLVERDGDIPYDPKSHSSFSLWVNHRETFTGITDNDRSLTIRAVAEQVKRSLNGGGTNFGASFRTPGHVPLLRAADRLLDERCGQTELSIALAELAGVTPAVTVCEMLDDETGCALSKEDAKAYARKHGLVFIEGKDVVEKWSSR